MNSVRHYGIILGSAALAVMMTGCATTRREAQPQTSFADSQRIARLEAELQGKNEMIRALESEVQQLRNEPAYVETEAPRASTPAKTYRVVRSSLGVSVQTIQKALKRAGYYSGPTSGTADLATKRAVEAFQRAGGLTVDGVVGPKTWTKLKRFSNG